MTKDVNQITLVGNLTRNPEFSESNGRISAKIYVATGKFVSNDDTTMSRKDVNFDDSNDYDSGTSKETVYHEVRIYVDHIVSICKRLKAGDRVVIGGELRTSRNSNGYVILLAPQARFYKVE